MPENHLCERTFYVSDLLESHPRFSSASKRKFQRTRTSFISTQVTILEKGTYETRKLKGIQTEVPILILQNLKKVTIQMCTHVNV